MSRTAAARQPLPTLGSRVARGGAAPWVRRPGVFLGVILTAQLMVVLDATIVNVALPHIQSGLGFSATSLSWVVNAYVLTFGGFLLLGARTGDLVGRRRTFLVGIALFSASSLVGGFATSSWMLLGARGAQGLGAALAAPTALSLLTTFFPEGPQRVRAIALYTAVSAAGGATGLVAGGLLTELVSWRWVMFVNVPIGIAVLLLGRVALSETESRHGRFDLLGAITSTSGVSAVVLGLVRAGTGGWTNPVTLGAFVLGIALLAVFVHNESRVEEPILPLRLFAHSTRTTSNLARGLMYAGTYGMFFFLSQFFQDVQGFSPLRTGIAFLPMPASVFLSSQLTSRVLTRRFSERTLMLGGAAFAGAGLFVAARIGTTSSYWEAVTSIVLLGLGSGISFVSLTSASLAEVAPGDAGAAAGLINVAQQLGAALGLAVLVTAFGAITGHVRLGGAIQPAALDRTHQVIVHGIDEVFAIALGFTLVAFLLIAALIRPVRAPVADTEPAGGDVAELDEDPELEGWLAGRPALELS